MLESTVNDKKNNIFKHSFNSKFELEYNLQKTSKHLKLL